MVDLRTGSIVSDGQLTRGGEGAAFQKEKEPLCYSPDAHPSVFSLLAILIEKRRCRRIRFSDPLAASLSKRLVHLLDLSTLGARLQHSFPLGLGKRRILEFELDGKPVALESLVVRSRLESDRMFQTGVRFTEPLIAEAVWDLIVSAAIDELRLTEE